MGLPTSRLPTRISILTTSTSLRWSCSTVIPVENAEIGAFIDNECRGAISCKKGYYFLTVMGSSEEDSQKKTELRVYVDGEEYMVDDTLPFISDAAYGTLDEPYVLNIPNKGAEATLSLVEGWNWVSHGQAGPLALDAVNAKALRILSQTQEAVFDESFGWVGNLLQLAPATMYKVLMKENDAIALDGTLFPADQDVELKTGWNWLGYPLPFAAPVDDALSLFQADDDDAIVGLDGISQYQSGQWIGTLDKLVPGQGYMYKSATDKNLRYNTPSAGEGAVSARATASRKANVQSSTFNVQSPDKHRYPAVMGVMAQLCHHYGLPMEQSEWVLAAFCGDECRGLSQCIMPDAPTSSLNAQILMMNVYGQPGDLITFRAINVESGGMIEVECCDGSWQEHLVFHSDIVGSLQQPCQLTMGVTTALNGIDTAGQQHVYDLQGRRLNSWQSAVKKGIYIVTGSRKSQKVVH